MSIQFFSHSDMATVKLLELIFGTTESISLLDLFGLQSTIMAFYDTIFLGLLADDCLVSLSGKDIRRCFLSIRTYTT